MTQSMTKNRSKVWRWIGGGLAAAVVVLGGLMAYMSWRMNYVPANLDYSTTRTTEKGLYKVSYTPSATPIPINKLHTWTLRVQTADGKSLDGAQISIDGDMPQHGHGMPTKPQMTEVLGNGQYLIEGMKFQMGGWWVVDFTVLANGQSDKVRFNLMLR